LELERAGLAALLELFNAVQEGLDRVDHGGTERLLREVFEEPGREPVSILLRNHTRDQRPHPREPEVLEGIDLLQDPQPLGRDVRGLILLVALREPVIEGAIPSGRNRPQVPAEIVLLLSIGLSLRLMGEAMDMEQEGMDATEEGQVMPVELRRRGLVELDVELFFGSGSGSGSGSPRLWRLRCPRLAHAILPAPRSYPRERADVTWFCRANREDRPLAGRGILQRNAPPS
jgi:hypothetical protein